MKVAIVTSEAVPFAKTGGLADVTGALFKEFTQMQVDTYLFLPLFKTTFELFKDSLCPTDFKLDIPLGRTKEECSIYTLRGDLQQRKRPGEDSASAGVSSFDRVFFISNDAFFCRDELYGTAEGD